MAEDMQINREIVLEADAETLAKLRREGHAPVRREFVLSGSAFDSDPLRQKN